MNAQTAIAVIEEAAARDPVVAPPSETAAILQVIERAAQNPSVDIDKMERLFEMRERALSRSAREAYDAAFADMQVKLPTIDQNGRIVIEKNGVVQQSTPFAKFEDINDAIKPVLAVYGFGLSFRSGVTPEGRITITGILSHRGGHREENMMILPHDSTGSKNAVQAIGSSSSYGRRYTTLQLLNITSRMKQDSDDDGEAAGAPQIDVITPEQVTTLRQALSFAGRTEKQLCERVKVTAIEDIRADKFADVLRIIQGARK